MILFLLIPVALHLDCVCRIITYVMTAAWVIYDLLPLICEFWFMSSSVYVYVYVSEVAVEEWSPQEQRAREKKALLAQPSKDDIPLGCSGRTALRKEQCDLAPKSRIIERPMLDNGSVATNPAPFSGQQ
jgi:hypothetical protein